MAKARRQAGLLLSCLVLFGSTASAGAAPTVAQMLSFRPKQEGVEITTPAAEEQARCKVELVKTGRTSGWLLRDEKGEPLRRYHRLRKRVLGLDTYHNYDSAIPLVDFDRQYPYEHVLEWLPASVEPLGSQYQAHMREALATRWIDVYENPGKRSGAYSAPVYGVHPYMLLNYNDTLDAVFTLAHEMGHSMHTILSNAHQPFVYSAYTIFIAEVPSTLSEMFFLDYMLAHATDDREHFGPAGLPVLEGKLVDAFTVRVAEARQFIDPLVARQRLGSRARLGRPRLGYREVAASTNRMTLIAPDGSVEFVHPVAGPPALVPAALDSVRQWTFRPMLRDGKPDHGTAVVDVVN